jgi:glutathione S-transferase-like protein
MKLYVCYGTFPTPRPPHGHPCRNAHKALERAGHEHEVQRVYGGPFWPLTETPGRRHVKELTGQTWVPTLKLDDGSIVQGSDRIIEWAETHPA